MVETITKFLPMNQAFSDSDSAILLKKSSKVMCDKEELPSGLRRGRRPRTQPRGIEDFGASTSQKIVARAPIVDSSSASETEDNIELYPQKTSSLFASDDVEGQNMFKFKSRHTRMDLQNKVNAALASPKTPAMARLTLNNPHTEVTPKQVKEIMKKRIINTIQSDSDSDFSASSSDFVPDKSEDESSCASSSESEAEVPVTKGRTLRTQLRRTDTKQRRENDYVVAPDSYFMMHSGKKNTTSDHTLERLKNYNPSDMQIDIDNLSEEHKVRLSKLNRSHEQLFDRWMYALSENYSILLYGVGSKRNILQKFQVKKLKDFPCINVNGFFPSLTIKSILDAIVTDLLEHTQVPSNLRDTTSLIDQELSDQGIDVFLIIHNIDGVMLQNNKAQSILANLSQITNLHTIASVDHINAPLVWDHTRLSRFAFTWWDVTTFCPYAAETSYENSLTSRRGGALQLSSLRSVYKSLTSNAKKVFNIIVEHQLQNQKVPHYQGLPFKELYSRAREQFLVSSDAALRAQLTEFLDHKLLRARVADAECLHVPIDNALLQQFLHDC